MKKQGARKQEFNLLSAEQAKSSMDSLTDEQRRIMDSIAQAYTAAQTEFDQAQTGGATPDFRALFQKQMAGHAVAAPDTAQKLADGAAALKEQLDAAPDKDKAVEKVFQQIEKAAQPAAANDAGGQPPAPPSPPAAAPPAPPPPPESRKMGRRAWLKKAGAGGLLALAWLAAGGTAYKVAESAVEGTEKAAEEVEKRYPEVSGPTAVDAIDIATMTYFLADMAMLSTGRKSGLHAMDYAVMAGFLAARGIFGGPEVAQETEHTLSHAAREAAAILVFATAVEGIGVDLGKALRNVPNYDKDMAVQLAANFAAASMISPVFSTITSCAALQQEMEKMFFSSGKMNKLLATIAVEHHANMSGATGIDGDPPTFHNIGVFGLGGAVALQTVYGLPLAAYSLVSALYKANVAVLMGPDAAKIEDFRNPTKWVTLDSSVRAEAWNNTKRGLAAVAPYMPAFMGHSLANLAKYAANPLTGFRLSQDERGLEIMVGQRLMEAASNTFKVLAFADPHTRHEFSPAAHLTSDILRRTGEGMTEVRKTELDPMAAHLEGLIREAGQQAANNLKNSAQSMTLLEAAMNSQDADRRKAAYAALVEQANRDFGKDKAGGILQTAASLNAFQDTLELAAKEPLLRQSNPMAVAKRLSEKRLELAMGPAVFETVKTIGFQTMALPALSNTIGMMIKGMRHLHMPETAMRSALLMAEWQFSKDADNWACHTGVSDGAAKEGLAMYGSSTNMSINGGAKKEDGNPGPTKKIIAATRGELHRQDVAQGSLVHMDTTVVSLGYSLALDAVNAERTLFKALGIEHPADKAAAKGQARRRPVQAGPKNV